MSNVSNLNKTLPETYVKSLQNCAFIADSALTKTKEIIFPNTYETLNPQNKVLMHGIFFKHLFDKYLELLQTEFNDVQLKIMSNEMDNRPKISKTEYNDMPKRYRGVFVPFGKDNYVLNCQDEPRPFFTVKKSNRPELETLLDSAKMLIPVIYHTKWIDNNTGSKETLKAPYFTPKHSLKSHFVNDKQLSAIYNLGIIFRKIDQLTQIRVKEAISERHGAVDIYNEYLNEFKHQKDRYTNAQNKINSTQAETEGLQYLLDYAKEEEKSGIQVLLDIAKQNSEKKRAEIIAYIQKRVR